MRQLLESTLGTASSRLEEKQSKQKMVEAEDSQEDAAPFTQSLVCNRCWAMDPVGARQRLLRGSSGCEASRSSSVALSPHTRGLASLPPQSCFISVASFTWGDNKVMGCFLWVVCGNAAILNIFIRESPSPQQYFVIVDIAVHGLIALKNKNKPKKQIPPPSSLGSSFCLIIYEIRHLSSFF